jgi:hypothetical protein
MLGGRPSCSTRSKHGVWYVAAPASGMIAACVHAHLADSHSTEKSTGRCVTLCFGLYRLARSMNMQWYYELPKLHLAERCSMCVGFRLSAVQV